MEVKESWTEEGVHVRRYNLQTYLELAEGAGLAIKHSVAADHFLDWKISLEEKRQKLRSREPRQVDASSADQRPSVSDAISCLEGCGWLDESCRSQAATSFDYRRSFKVTASSTGGIRAGFLLRVELLQP
jgi:hypothetical protein